MRLLVPIGLEAILCGKNSAREQRVCRALPRFENLSESILGVNVEAPPFSTAAPLKAGAHLHFILPDGLTHGQETADGVRYPPIPDRWLVTRIMRDADGFRHRSWMVESSYLGREGSGVPIPTLDQAERYCFLGRSYPFGTSHAEGKYLENLTVTGPGDPTFAAYYPSCGNVLGFHDDLTDYPRGPLTYLVSGRYAGENDPLAGLTPAAWQERMEEFCWALSEGVSPPVEADGLIHCGILCHGLVCGLEWQGPNVTYDTGVPTGHVEATVGDSSQEALSALLSEEFGASGDEMEFFLNALQADLLDRLDQPDGEWEIQDALRDARFALDRDSRLWRLTAQGKQPPPPDAVRLALEELNRCQQVHDSWLRQFADLRQRLYGAWHTYLLRFEDPYFPAAGQPDRAAIYKAFKQICTELETELTTAKQLADRLENAKAALRRALEEKECDYEPEIAPAALYRQPNAPVLLLSGDGLRRGFLYGEDGRFSRDGTLTCRLSDSMITRLNVSREGETACLDSECLDRCCTPWVTEPPDCMRELLCETLLLDISAAPLLAKMVLQILQKPELPALLTQLTEQVICLQTLPWSALLYPALCNPPFGFVGTPPCKLAVNYWKPAWNTLFLEWKISYCPTRADETPKEWLRGWELAGSDYTYVGCAPSEGVLFSGRTVATPHSQKLLQASLAKQIEVCKNPEVRERLEQILGRVGNLQLLSQSLGDFSRRLTGLRSTIRLPLLLTGEGVREDPLAKEMTKLANHYLTVPDQLAPIDSRSFFPIRAGFLKIEEIQLVSSFGHRQTIVAGFERVRASAAMKPPRSIPAAAMLPPRIPQGGRMSTRWTGFREGTASPVCGYAVPNRLNRGMMVYDSLGRFLGTAQTVYRGEQTFCVWQPSPLSEKVSLEETDFGSVHLRELVRGWQDSPAGTFVQFLDYLDERQSHTLPGASDDETAAFCGRPLVLARLEISFALQGLPACLQSMDAIGRYDSLGFTETRFQLEIGDARRTADGCAGYFAGGTQEEMYRVLHACGDSVPQGDNRYIDWVGRCTLDHGEHRTLSLSVLTEPSSMLTVRCGIYPTARLRLPVEFCEEALKRMCRLLALHPILCTAERVSIPFSEPDPASWSWVYRNPEEGCTEIAGISPDAAALTGEHTVVVDGYLLKKGEKTGWSN